MTLRMVAEDWRDKKEEKEKVEKDTRKIFELIYGYDDLDEYVRT